eukprot:Awhi_evm1s6898
MISDDSKLYNDALDQSLMDEEERMLQEAILLSTTPPSTASTKNTCESIATIDDIDITDEQKMLELAILMSHQEYNE